MDDIKSERRRRQPQQSSSRIREEKQNNIQLHNKSSISQATINSRKRKTKAAEEQVRPIKGKKAITKSQQKTKSKQIKDEAQIVLDQLIAQGSYEMHNYESDFERLFKDNMIYYVESDDKVHLKKKGANRQIFDKTYLLTRESMQRSGKIALNDEELKRSGENIKQQQVSQTDTKGVGNNILQAKLAQLDITTHLLNHTSMLPEDTLDKVENLLKTVNVGSIQEINNMLIHNHNNNQNNLNNFRFNGDSQINHKIIGIVSPLKEALPEGVIINESDHTEDESKQNGLKLALAKALAKFNIPHPKQHIEESNAQQIAQQNQVAQREKLALVSAYLQNNSDFSMRKPNPNLYKEPTSKAQPTQQAGQQRIQKPHQNPENPEPSNNNQNLDNQQIQEETHNNAELTTTSIPFQLAPLPFSLGESNLKDKQIPNQGTQLNVDGFKQRLDNSINKKQSQGVTIKKEPKVPSGNLKTIKQNHPKQIIEITSDSQNSQNQQNIQSQESGAGLIIPENEDQDKDKQHEMIKDHNQQITKNTKTNKTNNSPSVLGNCKVESQIPQDPSKIVSNPKNILKPFQTSSPSLSLQQLLFQSPSSKHQQIQLQQQLDQSPSVLQKPNPIRPKSIMQSPQISNQLISPNPHQSYLESSLFVPKQLFQSANSVQFQKQQEQAAQFIKTQQFTAIPSTPEKQLKQTKNQRNTPNSTTNGMSLENNDAFQKLALQQLLQVSNTKSDCFNTGNKNFNSVNAITTGTPDKSISNMTPTFSSPFQLHQSISQPLQQLLQTKMSNSLQSPQPLPKVNGFQQRSIGVSVPIKNQSKMIVLPGNNQHITSHQSLFNPQSSTASNLNFAAYSSQLLGSVISNLENQAKKDKNTSNNNISQSNFNTYDGNDNNNNDQNLKNSKNKDEKIIIENSNDNDRNETQMSLTPQNANKEVLDGSEVLNEQNNLRNQQEKGSEQIKDYIPNQNNSSIQIELENENINTNDNNKLFKDQLDKLHAAKIDQINNITNPQSLSSSPSILDTKIHNLLEPSSVVRQSKITVPPTQSNNVIIPSTLQIQTTNETTNPEIKNIHLNPSPQIIQPITITIESSQETTAVANQSQEDNQCDNNLNNNSSLVNNTSFKNNNESILNVTKKIDTSEIISHQTRENVHTNVSSKPQQNKNYLLKKKQHHSRISFEVDDLKDPQSLEEDIHADQMEQEQWPFQQLHCINMEMEQENN